MLRGHLSSASQLNPSPIGRVQSLTIAYRLFEALFGENISGFNRQQNCQFVFRIHMLKQIRFPPLPKIKPLQSSVLNIQKINAQKPNTQVLIQKMMHRPKDRQKSMSNQISQTRGRPLSSRSAASTRSRESSNASYGSRKIQSPHNSDVGSPYFHMPRVTAKSWILFEMRQGRNIFGKRNFKRRQIASLTKMLNLLTILELMESLKLDSRKIKARASQRASSVNGTTAQIKVNRVYSLEDLYYGMMLPSGNDAATMIAEIGGCFLKAISYGNSEVKKMEDQALLTQAIQQEGGSAIGMYLRQMNKVARRIGMMNTNLVNPHGLSNTASYSTATDLAKLCTYAMKNDKFRRVVNAKSYTYTYRNHIDLNDEDQDKENVRPNLHESCETKEKEGRGIWENTNRMLGKGWSGIKTGITPNAGPCLAASCLKTIDGRQLQFLVILLSSQSMEARWSEVEALVDWAISYKLYQ